QATALGNRGEVRNQFGPLEVTRRESDDVEHNHVIHVIANTLLSASAGTSSDNRIPAPSRSPRASTTASASTTMMPNSIRFTTARSFTLMASLRATHVSVVQ